MPCQFRVDIETMKLRAFTLSGLTIFLTCGLFPAQGRSGIALPSLSSPSTLLFQDTPTLQLQLPLKPNSVRFAVIGDMGTGHTPQREVATEMELYRRVVGFTFVLTMGDIIYGGDSPADFSRKFEQP